MRSYGAWLFDAVQAIAITLWVGTLWSTGVLVAPVLFRMIGDRTLAGDVAGHLFGLTAFIGLACGGSLLTIRFVRERMGALRRPLFWLVVTMFALVCVSQFLVHPTLAGLRAQAHLEEGVMRNALPSSFAIWHAAAGVLYLAQSVLGLVLVTLSLRAHTR